MIEKTVTEGTEGTEGTERTPVRSGSVSSVLFVISVAILYKEE